MDDDEIINLEVLVLHHEQADVALHTLGLAVRDETINGLDLHWNAKTHGCYPRSDAGDDRLFDTGSCKHELIEVELMYINKPAQLLEYKSESGMRSLKMSSNKTLILGVGNSLLSDEATGIHMLSYMQHHYPGLTDVEYLDGGTLSFTLATWIEEVDNLIVIDAAELKSTPGTVASFVGEEMDRFVGRTKRSVHEVSLGDLLAIAHLTDCLPTNRALVAIQPENIDWGQCLSNGVKQALPVAGRRINELVLQWQSPRPETAITDDQPADAMHG